MRSGEKSVVVMKLLAYNIIFLTRLKFHKYG